MCRENPSICLIVGAAPDTAPFVVLPDDALVIAADGGMRALTERQIVPDVILGDFDSSSSVPEDGSIIRFPVEKDDTDTELAADYGYEAGCRTFHIYGGTGGRFDHTLANIQLMIRLAHKGCRTYLIDRGFIATVLVNGTVRFRDTSAGQLSVFAVNGEARGVTVSGLKYTAENITLTESDPIGVSNAFAGTEASVSVQDGTLLLIWSNLPENAYLLD